MALDLSPFRGLCSIRLVVNGGCHRRLSSVGPPGLELQHGTIALTRDDCFNTGRLLLSSTDQTRASGPKLL